MVFKRIEKAASAPSLDRLLRVTGKLSDRFLILKLRHVLGGQQKLPDMGFRALAPPANFFRLQIEPTVARPLRLERARRVARAPRTDKRVAGMKLVAEPG